MTIPSYITQRLGQTAPTPCVVPHSTPVLGFGQFIDAQVATLGLNPSKNEFLHRGALLMPPHNRLESLQSLGLASLAATTSVHHQKILDACLNYFNTGRAYYWFNRFAPLLNQLGVSYAHGTACHLDLVQTATDPVWSKKALAPHRTQYLANDAWFLLEQLSNHKVTKLLLNGASVVRAVTARFGITFTETFHTSPCGKQFKFHSGVLAIPNVRRQIKVRGWNFNVQSSHGVTTAMLSSVGALC